MIYTVLLISAALSVFFISIAIVIGPTPPGTGVIAPATFSALSNSTSPTRVLGAIRFMPTSITTAPGFIISPVIKLAIPTAATRISAFFVFDLRSFVFEWHIVTVPSLCKRSIDIGFPTMFERPTITHSLPVTSIPDSFISSITPAGVQGTKS